MKYQHCLEIYIISLVHRLKTVRWPTISLIYGWSDENSLTNKYKQPYRKFTIYNTSTRVQKCAANAIESFLSKTQNNKHGKCVKRGLLQFAFLWLQEIKFPIIPKNDFISRLIVNWKNCGKEKPKLYYLVLV